MAGRVGRPKTVISDEDLAAAEALALLNCQTGTIAVAMGWDRQWLDQRPDILTKLSKKRAEHKIELRKCQYNQRKNPALAIFLGKNALGQADKQEHKMGLDEQTSSLLAMIDGKDKGKLPGGTA